MSVPFSSASIQKNVLVKLCYHLISCKDIFYKDPISRTRRWSDVNLNAVGDLNITRKTCITSNDD